MTSLLLFLTLASFKVTMKEKDLNKDGAINLNEFLGEMADNSQSEWHKVESDRLVSHSTCTVKGRSRENILCTFMCRCASVRAPHHCSRCSQ
ncbi:unnamed protein product [Cylicostephanus goldi]|uniref:EF-hand domain-containing protein n=1 Tax=Cylicostephanus goldi TaxID=71465 RepID=A0A3P6TMK6_CYLGO|nr:unnamed protein product [Cylicostephanus goldi]